MSDELLRLIPTDPSFVPTKRAQASAKKVLRAAFPDADEVASDAEELVAFQDCGESFERVRCPACARELATLNDLKYEEPQGFSRYALSVMNPNAELRTETLVDVERVLACRLRTIHQRI
jgi:hypothetical protein